MKRRIVDVLLSDTTAVRMILAISAILFGFGMLMADHSAGAYALMMQQAPHWLWALAFFVYGGAKLLAHNVHRAVGYSMVLLGLYLWLYVFLSFADNPARPMGSADVMILTLVIAEVWVGAGELSQQEG